MDRRVPGDAVAMRLEHRGRLGGERRVLQPRLGKPFGDAAVEVGIGRRVDGRALVVTLEVDRVDGACRRELGDERVRPLGVRVELEPQTRVEVEPCLEALRRRRLAEAHRDDERDLAWLPSDRVAERDSRLPKRQIERGALERPPAVVDDRRGAPEAGRRAVASPGAERRCGASSRRRGEATVRAPAGGRARRRRR